MTRTSAFLSVAFIPVLFVILSLVSSNDRISRTLIDPAGLTSDTQELSQRLLQESAKDIVFLENLGQITDTEGAKRPDVLFLTRSEGVDMYLTNSGMTYVFSKRESDVDDQILPSAAENGNAQDAVSYYRLDMEFLGMNQDISVRKELDVDQKYHYYTPDFPDGLSPKAYKKITIENLYDGIDLVYYEKEGKMKYDFILKAGADAGKIKMKYEGARSLAMDDDGSVVITTPMGEIREEKPYTYAASTGLEVESSYRVQNNTVQFEIAESAVNEDIIIDPVRIWATYYGGAGLDMAYDLCVDVSGNLYITGRTGGTDFPTQNLAGAYNQTTAGGWDAVIMKFDNNGARLWATYYGGGQTEFGRSICTDNSGNLFVAGKTSSSDFPTKTLAGAYNQTTYGGGYYDAFILKFDTNGARQWATYYGGSGTESRWDEIGICTDPSGNLYVTGVTESADFPTQSSPGAYNQTTFGGGSYGDAYILKFNNNGARQWASYYGGGCNDWGMSVCSDDLGNIFIVGKTCGTDLPTQTSPGAYNQTTKAGGQHDAFILKFDGNGIRQWATYYGGSANDEGLDICTDKSNNLYVTGRTNSTDFPTQTVAGAYNQTTYAGSYDGFILKFDNNGARQWATYYGGSGEDRSRRISTDITDHLYVGGWTASSDFPTKTLAGAYNQITFGGERDVFLLKFNRSSSRAWATYYGGSERDEGGVIYTRNADNIYVTGYTNSCEDFPLQTLAGAYNQTIPGTCFEGGTNWDAYILRFSAVVADFSLSNCAIGAGDAVSFTDQSLSNITAWNWTFEGGTPGTSTAQNPVVTYTTLGSYDVQLIVSDGTLSDTLLEYDLITVYGSGPADCEPNIDFFPADPLTHSGSGSNSTTLSFSPPRWDIDFTISDISQKLNGKPSNQYIEQVTVSYIDCSGQDHTYGTYAAASVSSANISIQDVVQSVTIALTDVLDGDSGNSTMSVTMGDVSSCSAPGTGCPDADGDGVCDADDICPGYDDNIDSDGDGIPDGCDNCTSVFNFFPNDPLTHSGTGSSSTTYNFGPPGHTDVSFVVSDLDAKTNGNPNNRYIELLTVTYTDAGGTWIYGTFSGENTSSVDVDLTGPVYSVTLTLEDAYDGNPPGTLSVDPGSISSCPPAGALQVTNDVPGESLHTYDLNLQIYPNPVGDRINFRLHGIVDAATLTIYDHLGRSLWTKHVEAGQRTLQLELANSAFPDGMYLVSLVSQGERITRQLVVLK